MTQKHNAMPDENGHFGIYGSYQVVFSQLRIYMDV